MIDPHPVRRPVPWSAWDVLAIVGLVVAVFIILAVVLGTVFQFVTAVGDGDRLEEMLSSPLANSLFWLLQWCLTLGVAFTYLKLRGYQLSLSIIGYRKTGVGHAALLIFGILFGSFFFQAIYVTYITEPSQEPVTGMFGTSIVGFIVAMFIVAVLTPVVEETFFRGIIHQGLEQRFGFLAGAVMSSIIFMLAHVSPSVYLPIFVLGFGFAALMSQTKSIWPSIVAHALWNSLGVIAQFFSEGG